MRKWLWRVVACVVLYDVLVIGLRAQPNIVAPQLPFKMVRVAPTGAPSVRSPIDKTKLIIQQNIDCWMLGAPGKTCDPGTRTYR